MLCFCRKPGLLAEKACQRKLNVQLRPGDELEAASGLLSAFQPDEWRAQRVGLIGDAAAAPACGRAQLAQLSSAQLFRSALLAWRLDNKPAKRDYRLAMQSGAAWDGRAKSSSAETSREGRSSRPSSGATETRSSLWAQLQSAGSAQARRQLSLFNG